MSKKYVLHPGIVPGAKEGEIVRHMNFHQLRRAYGLCVSKCIIGTHLPEDSDDNPNHIHLYPDNTGKYELPESAIPAPE